MREILLIAAMLLSFKGMAQIVNIEKQRHVNDTSGFSGGLNAGGAYLNNGAEVLSLSGGSDMQFKSKGGKDLFLILSHINMIKAGDQDFDKSSWLHFRYNRKINPNIRLEAFSQIQENEIDLVNLRSLTGFGPRWKVTESDFIKVYLGSLPMLEYERLDDAPRTTNQDFRWSNYVSFTMIFSEHARLYSTTYYQPRFDAFEDARILTEESLEADIAEKFSLNVGLILRHDAFPALGAPKDVTRIRVGLGYSF